MPLPASQQALLAELRAADQAASAATSGTQPAGNEPPPAEQPSGDEPPVTGSEGNNNQPQGDRVTLSREEFNALQAASDRVRAAEAKVTAVQEQATLDREVLEHRLTELENASKGVTTTRTEQPGAADEWQPSDVQITDEERGVFGEDTEQYIRKIVQDELNKSLPKVLKSVKDAKGVAENAVASAQRREEEQYVSDVKSKVPDFDTVVQHQHWHAFLQSEEENSGLTYGKLLEQNYQRRDVGRMVKLMEAFKKKYGVGAKPSSTGYEGALPGAGGGAEPSATVTEGKLPISARKKASKDYIDGRITYTELQTITAKYDEAEKKGLVDYNK